MKIKNGTQTQTKNKDINCIQELYTEKEKHVKKYVYIHELELQLDGLWRYQKCEKCGKNWAYEIQVNRKRVGEQSCIRCDKDKHGKEIRKIMIELENKLLYERLKEEETDEEVREKFLKYTVVSFVLGRLFYE